MTNYKSVQVYFVNIDPVEIKTRGDNTEFIDQIS